MEKRPKRARGSNWNHAHTMALAELKREASLNEEHGPLVWERIAQTLSGRFPGQIRIGAQCRRRWDTLVKVYNHIEDYCVQTGAQNHRELDEGELASMKLDTAYQQDWYDIMEQVCNQRKRKEKCDRGYMLAKRSKSSHSVELPERPSNRDSLCSTSTSKSVTYHEQSTPESTSSYAQVSFSPSLEVDKLNPQEEVPRLRNKNDGLVLEMTQLRHTRQVSQEFFQEAETLESANLLLHTFPAENGAQVKEPLQDELWDLIDATPIETLVEIEQSETVSELTKPLYWDLGSGGLVAQLKGPLQDHVRDDSFETANTPRAQNALDDLNALDNLNAWNFWEVLYTRNASVSSSSSSGVTLFSDPVVLSSAIMTASTSSRSADSTISRPRRRWSLKVIFLKIRQSCLACGCKERAEDMEMESKQAVRLKEKALMPRKENIREMFNAASPPSATSATKGYSSVVYRKTPRTSKQTALDKQEEESRARKAPERQQVGGKSSSKCVPTGKWCAKWSRKLRFPAFHSKSSH